MKIKVSQLKPNPFRDMKRYPIDEEKVSQLAKSMQDTTFWDNILARPAENGFYEIAYGHHRLFALKKVMPKGTVDIPVRPLKDDEMLRIMANENAEDWGSSTATDYETIRTVREFLRKNPTVWADQLSKRQLIKKVGTDKGPGAAAISKFLGGVWSKSKVDHVLRIIVQVEKGKVDLQAVRKIPEISKAEAFANSAMKGQPASVQHRFADRVIEKDIGAPHIMDEAIREVRKKTPREKYRTEFPDFSGGVVTNTTCPKCGYSW